jgi:hypothetical protein
LFYFRTAQQEEVVRRVRYPRHVARDGLVRPYISHEAMGFYILNVNQFFIKENSLFN